VALNLTDDREAVNHMPAVAGDDGTGIDDPLLGRTLRPFWLLLFAAIVFHVFTSQWIYSSIGMRYHTQKHVQAG
jgi:hypothetical protein